MELAALLGVHQTNIAFWERSPKPPRSDLLQPMAAALSVSVEALLSPPATGARAARARKAGPKGHVAQLFDAVARLPRRQQRRIIDVVEALLDKLGSDDAHAA